MMNDLNFFEVSLVDDVNFISSISAYRIIDKGVDFSIKVSNLDTEKVFTANLCSEDLNFVASSSNYLIVEGEVIFNWKADVTENIPNGIPLMLEIFDTNKNSMYRKEKFAIARNTSAMTR